MPQTVDNPLPFPFPFVTGGTLPLGAPSYIERKADRDLFEALLAGDFCYVLNSRQIGKSSLCVRVIAGLREAGVRTAFVDLSRIGAHNATVEQWYAGLMAEAGRELELRPDFLAFRREHDVLPPVQRFFTALRQVALEADPRPLVVFIDEIDAVRSLPFSADEFFGAIRACYNARTDDPAFQRLTFCLVGAATPADLIRDTRISPFNVGRRIELRDFTLEEAAPLLPHADALLKRVLYWTGGHPYLTQRLCSALAASDRLDTRTPGDPDTVDSACADLFFSKGGKENDDNLAFVRNRLLRSEADLAGLLELLRSVRFGRQVMDDDTNPLTGVLRLSGVCREESGRLRIRNRIYERVFDERWIRNQMPDAELRRQRAAFRRGVVRTASVFAAVLAVIAVLAGMMLREKARADRNASNLASALDQVRSESKAKGQALKLATEQTRSAKEALGRERHQRTIADLRTQEAKRSAIARDAALSRATANESEARKRASEARAQTYLASMRLIQREYEVGNYAHVLDLLGQTRLSDQRGIEWSYWDRLMQPRPTPINKARNSLLLESRLSPDGRQVVCIDEDGVVRVMRADTGEEQAAVPHRCGKLRYAALSPDGNGLITYGRDRAVRLWDAARAQQRALLQPDAIDFVRVVYSPDGRTVLALSSGRKARMWDATSGRPVSVLPQKASVEWAAYSPDGRRLATVDIDDNAHVFDASSGRELATFTKHRDIVNSITFSPDGSRVITADGDDFDVSRPVPSTARIWDSRTGKEQLVLRHPSVVRDALFSPNGQRVLTRSNKVRLWDAASGREIATLGGTWVIDPFSTDGSRVMTSDTNHRARIWDAETGKEIVSLRGQSGDIWRASFSRDNASVLTIGRDQSALLWKIHKRSGEFAEFATWSDQDACLSPDGRKIVGGRWGGGVGILDTSTCRVVHRLFTKLIDHMELSPDGSRIVVTDPDGINIWNADTGAKLLSPRTPSRPVYARFSPDGQQIAILTVDGKISLWNPISGVRAIRSQSTGSLKSCCAFSPDGQRLAVTRSDNSVSVLHIPSGQSMAELRGHTGEIYEIEFSREGSMILTASADATARVWSSEGHLLEILKGHTDRVTSCKFSPDGRRVVTASADKTAKLWDTRTGQELLELNGHASWLTSVAFSRDGSELLTSAFDDRVRIWFFGPDHFNWDNYARYRAEIAAAEARAAASAMPGGTH